MWRLAYNLFVHALFPVFAAFAVTNGKIRKTFFERMFGSTTGELRGAVWIHAASLGEAVIAENLIDFLRPRTPDPFVVTTNTYYARDLLRRKLKDRAEVTSMPFDLPYSVNRFMGNSTFSALILIETEIWPNLIWSAKKRGIPVIIINGRISDRTIGRYRRLSFFLKKVLASVDLVLAQSQEQARRFVSLGMKPARVIETGNLKYYRTLETGTLPKKENMVTFGSIREKEMDEITPVIAGLIKMFPAIRIFIVPREIQLIESIEKQLPGGVKISRYSDVKHNITPENEIVLVDTVGDLVGIYARSAVAFVGGSLAPYGGQNRTSYRKFQGDWRRHY
jgi:3-deoxy-D-manno-octulosonic-acid transferase